MTKTLLTFLVTSMAIAAAFGQTDKDEIKKTFEKYFQAIELKDNSKSLDYIYPKFFDHFPKDRMLEAMDRMKADTTIIITMDNPHVTSISETLELNGIKYARIDYSFKMTMAILATEDETESTEKDFNQADVTYEILKEKYGDKNVVYDRETSKLDINVTNAMYAINDPAYPDWKFLEKKENLKPLLEKILPKGIVKKL